GPRSLQKSKQLDPSISLAPEISIPVKYVPVKGLSKFDGAKLCPEYRSRISELRHRKSTFSGRDCPAMLQTMLQQKAKSRQVRYRNVDFGPRGADSHMTIRPFLTRNPAQSVEDPGDAVLEQPSA